MKWHLCILALGAAAAAQDQVRLADGAVVAGAVERIDAGGVVIRPAGDAAGRRIAFGGLGPPGITTAGNLTITLANGDRVTGRITGAGDGVVTMATAALGTIPVPVSALEPEPPPPPVADPTSKTAAQEVDAELEVFKPTPWKGRIGLSGALRAGNLDSSLFRLDAAIERLWRLDRFKAAADVSYGETDGITTASSAKGGGKWDHHYSKPFYAYALGEAGYDEIVNLDLRALFGAGAGYEFWHEAADRNFGAEAGLNALYEAFDGGVSRLAPAGRGALFYRDVFFEKLKFEQLAEILVPLDDVNRHLIRTTTTMTMPIAEHWNLRNILELQYQGDPPQDTEALDIKLLIGIDYTF